LLQDDAVTAPAVVVVEQQFRARGLCCNAPSAMQGPVGGRE
jgi:hypothetical protein